MDKQTRVHEVTKAMVERLKRVDDITKTDMATALSMKPNRFCERLANGTLFLRDFLEILHVFGHEDLLEDIRNAMKGADGGDRPIDAVSRVTERAAAGQARVRHYRQDGFYCHNDLTDMRQDADELVSLAVDYRSTVYGREAGPVHTHHIAAE